MRRRRTGSILALTLLGVALLAAAPAVSAQAIEPELQSVLDEMGPEEQVSVIVRFAQKVDLSSFRGGDKRLERTRLVTALKTQAATSQSAVEHILSGSAVTREVSLWAINGKAITASAEVIETLAHDPGVESIYVDALVEAPRTEAATDSTPEWNLDAVGAPELWAMGYTGVGVVVAGMDSGVDVLHQDLAPIYRGGSNSWLDPSGEHATPYDRTGHGTQSMGLIVGGSAGGTAIGMAPDAQWIAVKIFNDAGTAPLSGIHQGFQWVLDPDGDPGTDDAADVVNNSWSLGNIGGCDQEFDPDIQTLKAAGIAVAFSGGNYGPGSSTSVSPANNPSGFGVGAVNDLGLISSSSSSGPSACDGTFYPEVVAPGISVRTADLTFGGVFPGSYMSVSGTSFSTPHVAGAMALLLSAYPDATVEQLEQALTETAVDGGVSGADNDYGYGLIDVVAAESWLASVLGPVCTDLDGDLFFAEAGCGTEVDCDDSDAGINPAACDVRNDGIDQDCDGADRTQGARCDGGGGGDHPGRRLRPHDGDEGLSRLQGWG